MKYYTYTLGIWVALLCMLTPVPVHAEKKKRIHTKIMNYFFGSRKKKQKEQDSAAEQKPDTQATTPSTSTRTRPSQDPTLHHALDTLNQITASPELFSVLINKSIDGLLTKAQGFLARLTWATKHDFITRLQEKSENQKGKASMLLQITITQEYLDHKAPLYRFIQDTTYEYRQLVEYEQTLHNVLNNKELLQHHQEAEAELKHLQARITTYRGNLHTLNKLTIELLGDTLQPFSPQYYHMDHTPVTQTRSVATTDHNQNNEDETAQACQNDCQEAGNQPIDITP